MPADSVIRAVDHPYRRNILHILARGSLTYSQLFASMEPRGGGRGRFNYHLKVLRESGLIQAQDNHYGLTGSGEAAVAFLEEVNRDSGPRARLNIPRRHIGPLLAFSILGLAAVLLLWSILVPMASVSPVQPLEAGWSVPTSIETGELTARFGKTRPLAAVVADSDNGFAVWTQSVQTFQPGEVAETKLHTARFVPGTGWGEITSHDVPWRAALDLQMAVDPTGNVSALWVTRPTEDRYQVHVGHLVASGGWATPTLLDQGEAHEVALGEIEASSSGRVIATWMVDGETYASYYSDRGWEAPVRLGPSDTVYGVQYDIVMNAKGDAVALWFELNETALRLWARTFEAFTGWQAPVFLGTMGYSSPLEERFEALASLVEAGGGWPSLRVPTGEQLVVDERGNAVAVWGRVVLPGVYGGPIVWSQYTDQTGWTTPDLVVPDGTLLCDVEGSGTGDVTLLWRGGTNQRNRVYADSYTREMGWTGRESVFPAYRYGCPQLAVAPNGNALAVWRVGSVIWASYLVRPQSLEDMVEDIGDQLDSANAKLAGFELRFLVLAGVIVGLLASHGILLALYWYQEHRHESHQGSEVNSSSRRRE